MLNHAAATDSDIPALRSLAQVIWRACYPGILSANQIEYMLERMYDPEVIRRELAGGVRWELLQVAARSIGFVSWSLDPNGARLNLHKLYLLPEFQGQGLGQGALAIVQAEAAGLGLREIRLTVNKRNLKAIAAYKRIGFQITRAVVHDIGDGYMMDDFVMRWRCAAE